MKKFLWTILMVNSLMLRAQVTTIASEYKSIFMGDNGVGDYTRNLLLLHEMYNGTLLGSNYAVGTITAFRGNQNAGNRINIAEINSASAYNSTYATLKSFDSFVAWKLKTCIYNGVKYLAVDVPYSPAYHNVGFRFTGSTTSTGENMKSVAYQVNGQAVNQNIISDIQDYAPNMDESHFVNNFLVMGNVGIGTTAPAEKLSVNGKIRAKEIKVETANWPDYVFDQDYQLLGLQELDAYIKANKHLPDMPSAKEIEANGVELGEMNKLLLKKVEELTLHLIEKDKALNNSNKKVEQLESVVHSVLIRLQEIEKTQKTK